MEMWLSLNWKLCASLLLLLGFSELAAVNFKRLAPILEAWDQKRKARPEGTTEATFLWTGGWEKLAVLCWALGSALPFIVFAVSALLFTPSPVVAGDLVVGATLGGNIVALSLTFGLILSCGQLSFFRVRTMTSPIFLLLATVAFTMLCLDETISRLDAVVLLFFGVAYGFYFRRFSSEWKTYERHHASPSLLESSEGILPVVAVFCMALVFTVLAILFAYPFVQWLSLGATPTSYAGMALHLIAPTLAIPNILRALYSARQSDTAKALTLTGITHSCLLNTLFLCGSIALYQPLPIAEPLIRVDLAVLLFLTGVFVATLLIEKERARGLSWALIAGFLLYTGIGIFFP